MQRELHYRPAAVHLFVIHNHNHQHQKHHIDQ